VAFAGGIDLCDARWDDRDHVIDNSLRRTLGGAPQKPYHDVMAFCTGPVVASVHKLFGERWLRATGKALALPAPDLDVDRFSAALDTAIPMRCPEVAISLTCAEHEASGSAKAEQIKVLYQDAISSARKLIYIETQYLTSRAVHDALCDRMKTDRGALEIIVMLPMGADTPKENFALGGMQDWVLSSLCQTARTHGHALRVLYSAATRDDGTLAPTFIHSKVLIVDNRLMTIGSANCTNRSMSLDSELNWAWECQEGQPLGTDIARLRATLLSEHAGVAYDASLEATSGVIAHVDTLADHTKLRLRDVPESPDEVDQNLLIGQAFDPEHALTELELDEWLQPARAAERG